MEEWGYSPTSDDNISDSYWFSLASNFDEYATQFSQYTFSTSNREELIFKLRSRDTRMRERTTKTGLRPTLTVTSSVVFWTSTKELRKSRGGHSCKMKWRSGDILPLVTTIYATATGSVLLRISTSTHCSSRSTYSLEVLEKSQ
uniref:uncharacterized protein LOC127061521 n=1 Tax=Vespula vulgaris TaxID=7454 RepID=UPI00223B634D|nr:uncharacterized protein LOC127061521 [Vespula vulgaris]